MVFIFFSIIRKIVMWWMMKWVQDNSYKFLFNVEMRFNSFQKFEYSVYICLNI